ncbi:hypothetical protein AAZX31_02G178000 [Glycine max]
MNILSRNYRDTNDHGFSNLIKDISKQYDTTLMFLFESHANMEVVNRIIPKLEFDSYFVQDTYGNFGGIWCLWNFDLWKVEILHSEHQFVHMKIGLKKQPMWFITVVYGSPKLQERRSLWEYLSNIANSILEP